MTDNLPETSKVFLEGVSQELCLAALTKSPGNELASGKLLSPESSAALAVNTFGWFLNRPHELPVFPGLLDLDWPAVTVALERQMRFPWSAGRHPWLDAAVETKKTLIGIESKRFEPFRDAKSSNFSPAYDRDVWGTGMEPFTRMRDSLRATQLFSYLDAAQLVKHAFGLVTEARRIGKRPVLLYLFAEPGERMGRPLPDNILSEHRAEIARFSQHVSGAEVRFAASSYRQWLDTWHGPTAHHRLALINRFAL